MLSPSKRSQIKEVLKRVSTGEFVSLEERILIKNMQIKTHQYILGLQELEDFNKESLKKMLLMIY